MQNVRPHNPAILLTKLLSQNQQWGILEKTSCTKLLSYAVGLSKCLILVFFFLGGEQGEGDILQVTVTGLAVPVFNSFRGAFMKEIRSINWALTYNEDQQTKTTHRSDLYPQSWKADIID
jgi:hypothetical protein